MPLSFRGPRRIVLSSHCNMFYRSQCAVMWLTRARSLFCVSGDLNYCVLLEFNAGSSLKVVTTAKTTQFRTANDSSINLATVSAR
jgi:hypothetical protein